MRNLPDGKVEAVAEGYKLKLGEFISFCNIGPPGATVNGVAVDWSEFKGEYRGFRITH